MSETAEQPDAGSVRPAKTQPAPAVVANASHQTAILDWAKLILPLLLSWPTFAVLFLIFFKGTLIDLIDRFAKAEGSRAEIGPVKIEIGKVVLPPQYRPPVETASQTLKIDLSNNIAAIRDTGPLGSVVGYATAYALEIALKTKRIEAKQIGARGIYEVAKEHDEWRGTEYEGSSVLGALKGLKAEGFYWEQDWPSSQAKRPAGKTPAMKISSHTQLPNKVEPLIDRLKLGQAPVVSINIPDDFDKPTAGVVKVAANPKLLGGHAICIVGYSEEKKQFKFANSWGTGWGEQGYGYIAENDLKTIMTDAHVLDVGS